jgi:hypothetical protein
VTRINSYREVSVSEQENQFEPQGLEHGEHERQLQLALAGSR